METRILFTLLVSAALVLAACGKKEEPKTAPAPAPAPSAAPAPAPAGIVVSSVTAGSAIGADKKVTIATDSFRPDRHDVRVGRHERQLAPRSSTRSGPTARATSVAVVKEDSMTLATTGPATHEFHVSKPDGWPAGNYEVEVMLDGKSAGLKKLTVK